MLLIRKIYYCRIASNGSKANLRKVAKNCGFVAVLLSSSISRKQNGGHNIL